MMNQMDIEDRWHEPETGHMQVHGPEAFEGMRRAGRLAAETLDHVTPYVRPGVTTGELDRICHEFIVSNGAVPAPLNYRGFPKSICTSINHVVCHGIPGERRLDEGDILNIDVTVILDGWYGDTSRMYPVGKVGVRAQRLIDVTYEALMLGIEEVRPGASLADIGYVIQTFAERHGFSVVEDFCGHGLGRVFHAPPSVLHYVRSRKSDSRRKRHPEIRYTKGQEEPLLREGMFFTIEPMINAGRLDVKVLDDGWTAVTRDRSLSAQFEHTVAVTADGHEVFTFSPMGLHRPPYA